MTRHTNHPARRGQTAPTRSWRHHPNPKKEDT
jgi:hypothetical protein